MAQTHIVFIMPRPKKGLGKCHKSGTGNNQGRRRTTPCDNRGFNCNDFNSTSNALSLPVISVSLPLNNSVINPPQLSSVFNSHPGLHITLLVITSALIATAVTQRAMRCLQRWYLCFLHGMIHSLIQLSCPHFVNSHPALHITQRMSYKLLQYPVGLHLIRQIPCHRHPPIMEVAIFMDAWLMCLSLNWHNGNNIP